MSRQMFIFRMVGGHSGDDPFENTTINVDSSRIHLEISDTNQVSIDYTGDMEYMLNELSHSRLTQGWGVANPNLDLRLEERTWIENYIIACYKYWYLDTDPSHAMGRRKILGCMLDMHEGDIIFIPNGPDDKHFMVANVKRKYCFDRDTVVEENDFRNDFRHIIAVENIMRYSYGSGTLQLGIFEAPFRDAIRRIPGHDHSYRIFEDFLLSWGR